MNLIELNRFLRQLRLGGIAAVLETRLQQAQTEPMAPIDFLSCLVSDELTRRGDRLLERRRKQAQFRDPQATLDNFDFDFNKKMNRSLVFDLATATFVSRHDDALFLGPPGTGKSNLAQAIGKAVIDQGYRVIYREAHILLEEIAEAGLGVGEPSCRPNKMAEKPRPKPWPPSRKYAYRALKRSFFDFPPGKGVYNQKCQK